MESRANSIGGRVVLRETGVGIPDLMVVVSDLDPAAKPEEDLGAKWEGDSLGTVLTQADGTFQLDYEDGDFQISNTERRPDILLKVVAPEEPGQKPDQGLLFVSRATRQNAGRIEQYLIRIPTAILVKAGLSVPSSSLNATSDQDTAIESVKRLKASTARSTELFAGSVETAKARVDAYRSHFDGFAKSLREPLLKSLSSIPDKPLHPERIVTTDNGPAAANLATIKSDLETVVNSTDPAERAPVRGFISLTPKQVEALKTRVEADGRISADDLNETIGRQGVAPTTTVRREDLLPLCQRMNSAASACVAVLDDKPAEPAPSPSTDDSNETGTDGTHTTSAPAPTPPVTTTPVTPPIAAGDLPAFLGRLLDPLTAPEEALLTGLTPTATLTTVRDNVRDINFEPSPADAPAIHEFNQLQIAFRSVWQELIDRGVLDIAQSAYETIVELGGDPTRPEFNGLHPLKALKAEAATALRATRATLGTPTVEVRDHRTGNSGSGGTTSGTWGGATVRDHRGDTNDPDPAVRLPALLSELEAKMREKYAFTIFGANAQERSVNFGILNTFQQKWTPLAYQAGALVKSIPLAPKQTQKIVVTRKMSKKRGQKELENNLRVERDETSETSRLDQEIANRAMAKTSFSYENKAEGGVQGIGTDTSTTSFKADAQKSTDDVKKAFRESVFKSAQEVKNERTTEVTTEETDDYENTETTEISNPNDEIAVTYLFYELQRRYRLNERLYRVTPVVLVAQEVPSPDEIDQAWLIAHDWILRRAILDDSYLATLDGLTKTAGAETALAQLAANVAQQREIVAQLRNELRIALRNADVQNGIITGAISHHTGGGGLFGSIIEGVESAFPVVKAADNLLFGGDGDQNAANQNTLQSSADQAADKARDLSFRLEREVTALNSITESYAKALETHHNRLTDIARLRIHVKENILYYMGAIWRAEPPDQRYFRLHNTPIPTLKPTSRHFHIRFDEAISTSTFAAHRRLERFGGVELDRYPVETVMVFPVPLEMKPLCEMADLDQLLGVKGNYMIFPLLESNPLTDYMMDPYIDRATGELVDPSDLAGWSLDEFSDYVCCLQHSLSSTEFEKIKPVLQEQYKTLLTSMSREDDVLVVPTNSLFIECLPAGYSLIEKFKQDHRMIDVKKAQGEVRAAELENLRFAARILDGDLSDPKIDKRILVQGTAIGPVLPTD